MRDMDGCGRDIGAGRDSYQNTKHPIPTVCAKACHASPISILLTKHKDVAELNKRQPA